MNDKIRIEQELKQKLNLSQSMKMSLKILEIPYSDLSNFIRKEVPENFQAEINFKNTPSSYLNDSYISDFNSVIKEVNFFDFLEEQILYLELNKKIKDACVFVINNINESGYLEISKLEIKNILNLKEKEIEEVFQVIYGLEPYGVGAYSLEESLILQLKAKNIFDEKLFLFVNKYLYLLAEQKYDELINRLKVSKEELENYIRIIKSLNPKITRGFLVKEVKKIIPDIFITISENTVSYEINREIIPKINIEVNDINVKKINKILECIEKRFQTLDKIIKIVVTVQKDFFLTKGEKITILKEKEVAKELNMNSSTISRAIKEKYIQTNFGIIALKNLFIRDTCSTLIKKEILQIIEKENKEKPYSDKELALILKERGFNISRRTINKYREEIGYKNSLLRKIM